MADIVALQKYIGLGESQEALKIPNQTLSGELFTEREEFQSGSVEFVIDKDLGKIAPYTTRDGSPTQIKSINSEVFSFKPPIIYLEEPVSDDDLDKRSANRPNPYDESGQEKFLNSIGMALNRAVDRAMEVQAGSILQTGTATLKNAEGITLKTLDYGRDTALTYQVSTLWGANGNDPIKDLNALIDLIFTKSGEAVNFIAMGSLAEAAFLASSATKSVFDKNVGQYGNIERREVYPGGRLAGFLGSTPVWTIADTNVLASKKVVAASKSTGNGFMFAGVVSEITAQRVATSHLLEFDIAKRPARNLVILKSAPVVKVPIIDATGCITVLS